MKPMILKLGYIWRRWMKKLGISDLSYASLLHQTPAMAVKGLRDLLVFSGLSTPCRRFRD